MKLLSSFSFIPTHLFISSICTGTLLSGMILYIYSPSLFMSIAAKLYTNIMYLYTITEYNIERVKKMYHTYLCNNEPANGVKLIERHYIFICNNKIVDVTDDYDVHFVEIDKNVYVGQKITDVTDYNSLKQSNIKFISFDVNFQEGSNNTMYSLDLCNKSGNYLQIGNVLDKYVIWYLIKKQFGVCRYNQSYSINVIDNNVNMSTLTQENTVELNEESYIVN